LAQSGGWVSQLWWSATAPEVVAERSRFIARLMTCITHCASLDSALENSSAATASAAEGAATSTSEALDGTIFSLPQYQQIPSREEIHGPRAITIEPQILEFIKPMRRRRVHEVRWHVMHALDATRPLMPLPLRLLLLLP